MGKQDVAVNRMLERKEIFADLMNGTIFGGKQVLDPEKLELLSTRSGVVYEKNGKRKAIERSGDIRMQGDLGTYSVILAEETQNKVHYAMPVRTMLYDALEYTKQVQDLEKEHRRKGDILTGEEFLSGISKSDKLKPVLTTVLYFGDGKEWDGSKSLYEMMDIDEESEDAERLREYLPDYKLNIIQAEQFENPEKFQTCLRHIFKMIQCRKDKAALFQYVQDNREGLRKMDRVETMAAVTLLGEQKRLMQILDENEQEEMDMGSALTELIMDGKAEGRAEGKAEGRAEGRAEGMAEGRAEGKADGISIIRRKLRQGLKAQEIGDWTGLDVNYIREIEALMRQYPRENDVEIAGRFLNAVEKGI